MLNINFKMKFNTKIFKITCITLGLLYFGYIQAALQQNSKVAVSPDIKYETYCNGKFGFCVDYPVGILYPQGESGSGDGQIFKSKDAENTLRVYRDFRDNIDPDTTYNIETAYNEDSRGNIPDKPKRVITYKKLEKSFFVVSGYNNGKIFYQKTIMSNNQLATCIIEYREVDKKMFNVFSEKIFNSFK